MFKQVSKSVKFLFFFDQLIFILSTLFFANFFNLSNISTAIYTFLVSLVGFIVLFLKDNYKIREFNNTKRNAYLLFEGIVFIHVPVFLFLLFLDRTLNGVYFLISNILTIFLLLKIYRIAFHYYLFFIKKYKKVLIIGADANAKLIADEIENKRALRMQVVGFVPYDENEVINQDINHKIFKLPVDFKKLINQEKIDIVIVATKQRMDEQFLSQMIFGIPHHVQLYKLADFYERITGKYLINRMTANHLFYDFMNKRSLAYDISKRLFDIISASIILLVTAPILIYVGIRVKMTDGGPAVYTQNRVGKGGKVFKCYKLRTMYLNDYVPKHLDNGGFSNTQSSDSRVIPFCKFVRKARFDEIPQMINILKGEMSIVGPRTEWDKVVDIYKNEVPYYVCRMWSNTAWTGWAQINQGHCFSNDEESEKLAYDLYYLKNRNILWEIGILIKAVFLALGGRHG